MARNFSRRLRRTASRSRPFEFGKGLGDGVAGRRDRGRRVAVRAADRLRDDARR